MSLLLFVLMWYLLHKGYLWLFLGCFFFYFPVGLRVPNKMSSVKHESAACKANALPNVLSLWPPKQVFSYWILIFWSIKKWKNSVETYTTVMLLSVSFYKLFGCCYKYFSGLLLDAYMCRSVSSSWCVYIPWSFRNDLHCLITFLSLKSLSSNITIIILVLLKELFSWRIVFWPLTLSLCLLYFLQAAVLGSVF